MPLLRDIMISPEEGWPSLENARFVAETRSVCALVTRLLPEVQSPDRRLLIAVAEAEESPLSLQTTMFGNPEPRRRLARARPRVVRSWRGFSKYSDLQKQMWTLGVIQDGVQLVAPVLNWDTPIFEEVFEAVRARGFENSYEWGRAVRSPDGNHRAYLWVDHRVQNVTLTLHVRQASGLVAKLEVYRGEPHELDWWAQLGQVTWVSHDTVVLLDRAGRRVGGALSVHGGRGKPDQGGRA